MRIKDKIEEIENYLLELEEIVPENLEKYEKDFEKKAACERYFEKIIEAITDLVFLIIRNRKWDMPYSDTEALQLLADKEIISKELSEKLQKAKSMRNFIAHEYGEVDDEKVFEAVKNELVKDVKEFLELLGRAISRD
jgi:uncharacterized protein YutE (UPF0331/DUF86 family)